jgi:hypothetical protein
MGTLTGYVLAGAAPGARGALDRLVTSDIAPKATRAFRVCLRQIGRLTIGEFAHLSDKSCKPDKTRLS